MAAPSPLVLGVGLVGIVFVWSAVHGANISSTFKDLLAGKAVTPSTDPALAPADSTNGSPPPLVQSSTGPSTLGGTVDLVAIKAVGQMQATAYGWTGAEWTALDNLWTRESGWNPTATNPSSGAYGIAQFLDSTWATVGGTKTSDATLQIRYGLKYIQQRYGSPSAAWSHELSSGWY